MLIPSFTSSTHRFCTSLSRRVNANSQRRVGITVTVTKLIKKGEC